MELVQQPYSFMALVGVPALILFFFMIFVARQYRRCPSNKILVVYGRVSGQRASKCIHGGGVFVVPLFQDYTYMSLEPITIDIELQNALSKKNIRVHVPSTFTIGISTHPDIMNNASERLLSLSEDAIRTQARDIILGQLRLVIATLSIEEINQDREKFLDLVNKNVNHELNKIGLEVINVNIRDITDESGYIDAIGKRAAAEAINQAKVEVAQQVKNGAIGEATAMQEQQVSVATQHANAAAGQKKAERDQRVAVSKYEAEGLSAEAAAHREQQIAIAEQEAKAAQGRKQAEAEQRIRVSVLEAEAVKGENEQKANIAAYNAQLSQKQAEARRAGEVAMAEAARDVLRAQKEQQVAHLEMSELAQKEVDRKKIEIEAEAHAEQIRRHARGEADAILAKYNAEAEGTRRVLEAKADGYKKLLDVCGDEKQLATTLLMVEKLPDLVAEQVRAIQNLKIDKITVWDSGGGGNGHGEGSTAGFLKSLIGSLPAMHDLARQAGIELPTVLGSVRPGKSESITVQAPPKGQ